MAFPMIGSLLRKGPNGHPRMADVFAIISSVTLVVLLAILLRNLLSSVRGVDSPESMPETLAKELATYMRPIDLTVPQVKPVSMMVVSLPDYALLSGRLTLDQLFWLVNQYYQTVTEVADRHGGEIYSPTSGEIVVIFGRIMAVERPLLVAAASAVEIVARFGASLSQAGAAFAVCRGASAAVTYGESMSGPIGTERRRTYTTVGPVVERVFVLARQVPFGEVHVPAEHGESLAAEFEFEPVASSGDSTLRLTARKPKPES